MTGYVEPKCAIRILTLPMVTNVKEIATVVKRTVMCPLAVEQ